MIRFARLVDFSPSSVEGEQSLAIKGPTRDPVCVARKSLGNSRDEIQYEIFSTSLSFTNLE